MSHPIIKQENEEPFDRYGTTNMTVAERVIVYEQKLANIKTVKNNHKTEVGNIKGLCSSSISVLNFKLDEMTKKMRNEIHRLKEESIRHDDIQKIENKKIKVQVDQLDENCEGLKKALKEILDRIVNVEKLVGPVQVNKQ